MVFFCIDQHEKKNNLTGAKSDLLKAVDLGFADKERMLTQVEFQVVAKTLTCRKLQPA